VQSVQRTLCVILFSVLLYKESKGAGIGTLYLHIYNIQLRVISQFQSAFTAAQKIAEWVWPLTIVVKWLLSANLMYQNELLSVTGNYTCRFSIFPISRHYTIQSLKSAKPRSAERKVRKLVCRVRGELRWKLRACAEDVTQWNSGGRKYGEVEVQPDNCYTEYNMKVVGQLHDPILPPSKEMPVVTEE